MYSFFYIYPKVISTADYNERKRRYWCWPSKKDIFDTSTSCILNLRPAIWIATPSLTKRLQIFVRFNAEHVEIVANNVSEVMWFFFNVWVYISFSFLLFFYLCFPLHVHSRITGLQGKREGISLTHHYHIHPLHRHLTIGRGIVTESSPLHIASSWTRTWNLWFPRVRAIHIS